MHLYLHVLGVNLEKIQEGPKFLSLKKQTSISWNRFCDCAIQPQATGGGNRDIKNIDSFVFHPANMTIALPRKNSL